MFLFIASINSVSRRFIAQSPVASEVQRLEQKELPAGTAVLNSGVLTITGSSSVNDIQVGQNANGKLEVTIDGRKSLFNSGSVNRIVVNAGAGNDTFRVQQGVSKPITLSMGDGNDFAVTGPGNDVLNGGPGNDYLNAGSGADTLIGGPGADVMLLGSDRVRDRFFSNNADTVYNNLSNIDVGSNDTSSAKIINYSNPSTGTAVFQADKISLHRISYPGVDGVFYKVAFNGKLQNQAYRANAPIIIQVPGGERGGNFSITSSLKTFLESQKLPGGKTWLQFRAVNYVPPVSRASASVLPERELDSLFSGNFTAV